MQVWLTSQAGPLPVWLLMNAVCQYSAPRFFTLLEGMSGQTRTTCGTRLIFFEDEFRVIILAPFGG